MNAVNLCRICFGEGEYNLRDYKVKLDSLSPQPSIDDLDCKMLEEELTAQEMLKVFSENQAPAFGGTLICHPCLDELIPSFMFVQKVKFADKKIAKLNSVDNQKMEVDLGTIEYLADPQEEFLDENYKLTREEQENQITANEITLDDILDDNIKTTFEVEPVASSTSIGQKRKLSAKNPTIVLTGGVTQMLSHINRSSCTTKSPRSAALAKSIPQKRLKTQREKRNQQYPPAPLELGSSLVVTQFIPSTTKIQLETIYSTDEQLKDGLTADYTAPCNELRTMDYAAVEIQSSSDLQVNESDNYVSSYNNGDNLNDTTDAGGGGDPNSTQPIYVCKYCPQAFSAAHFLISHARKSHVCKFCTQAFSKSADLYEHIRKTHTEHRCAICGKELSTRSNLRSHIKRVHGVKLPAQVALLDYRISTQSSHQQTLEEKKNFENNNFEADLIDSIDEAEEDDKIMETSHQQQERIEFENNTYQVQQRVAATIDII